MYGLETILDEAKYKYNSFKASWLASGQSFFEELLNNLIPTLFDSGGGDIIYFHEENCKLS